MSSGNLNNTFDIIRLLALLCYFSGMTSELMSNVVEAATIMAVLYEANHYEIQRFTATIKTIFLTIQ